MKVPERLLTRTVCGLSSHVFVNRTPLSYIVPNTTLYTNVLHNLSHICDSPNKLLYLIAVLSTKSQLSRRNSVRQTWGSWVNRHIDKSNQGKLIFIVSGHLSNLSNEEKNRLRLEDQIYGDMVLMDTNFPDQYQLLSLKSLSVFHWLTYNCDAAEFFIKADIDSFWNIPRLIPELKKHVGKKVILGSLNIKAVVERDRRKSWHTYLSEYNQSIFPDYVGGGPGYIMTKPATKAIYKSAIQRPSFWLEDVYITGILADRANVKRIHLDNVYSCKTIPMTRRVYEDILASHYLNETEIYHLWRIMNN